MFVCRGCGFETLSSYNCIQCGGKVVLKSDLSEKPDKPTPFFTRVLWLAIFMLVFFVAVLDNAGLLWPLSD
jgi:hypothetical protein